MSLFKVGTFFEFAPNGIFVTQFNTKIKAKFFVEPNSNLDNVVCVYIIVNKTQNRRNDFRQSVTDPKKSNQFCFP